jgi:hypothetical protein
MTLAGRASVSGRSKAWPFALATLLGSTLGCISGQLDSGAQSGRTEDLEEARSVSGSHVELAEELTSEAPWHVRWTLPVDDVIVAIEAQSEEVDLAVEVHAAGYDTARLDGEPQRDRRSSVSAQYLFGTQTRIVELVVSTHEGQHGRFSLRLLAASATGPAADPDPSWRTDILREQNAVRARVSPAPVQPLRPLIWSDELEAAAQAWADGCPGARHSLGAVGPWSENLYFDTIRFPTSPPAAEAWAAEAPDYVYDTNRCAPGKVCGHYTQEVWRDTVRVGCAMKGCEANSPFGQQPYRLVVCEYDPPGNVIGQKPY